MSKMIRGYKKEEFHTPDVFSIDMSEHAKITYMYLQRLMDVEGDVSPSHNEVAHYCGFSQSTAKRAIKELENMDLIKIINRKKSHKENDTNLYVVYHPKQIETLKMLATWEEVKFKKKGKKKPMVTQTLPLKTHGHTDHTLKPMVTQTPPSCETSDIKGFEKTHGHTDQVTSLLDRLDSLVLDSTLSDQEIIKISFKEIFKTEINSKQSDSFIDIASEVDLSIQEVIEEMMYIQKEVKIKTTPDRVLYKSLVAGGWLKKKKEEESKKEQEKQVPKKKLKRGKWSKNSRSIRKEDKLPRAVIAQLENQELNEPLLPEQPSSLGGTLEEKQARVKAKIAAMNARFTDTKESNG